MSTKIFNGRLFESDIDSLLDRVERAGLREKIEGFTETESQRLVLQQITDLMLRPESDGAESIRSQVEKWAWDEYERAKTRRGVDSDFEAKIALKKHPFEPNQTLVGIFIENQQIHRMVTQELDLKEYWYTDNQERPQHITEEHWGGRARAWEMALQGKTWRDANFLILEIKDLEPLLVQEVFLLKPGRFEEVMAQCKRNSAVRLKNELIWALPPKTAGTGDRIEALNTVRDWVKENPQAKAIEDRFYNEVASLFPPIDPMELLDMARPVSQDCLQRAQQKYLSETTALLAKYPKVRQSITGEKTNKAPSPRKGPAP